MEAINSRWLAWLALALAVATGGRLEAASRWWSYKWRCRRAVVVPAGRGTSLDGDDIAVATIWSGGTVRADAADVRVATETMREAACEVLMIGPGDQVRVAFAVKTGITKYFVYFGNPDGAFVGQYYSVYTTSERNIDTTVDSLPASTPSTLEETEYDIPADAFDESEETTEELEDDSYTDSDYPDPVIVSTGCVDSDPQNGFVPEGYNPSVVGTCSDAPNGTFTDTCINNNMLQEYACGTGNYCEAPLVDCGWYNSVCVNGKCQ